MKATGILVASLMALSSAVRAEIVLSNTIVDSPSLAADSTYALDLLKIGVNSISAQANYAPASVAPVSFTDGTQSTGNLTVVDFASLTAASASNHLTVSNNAGLSGAVVTLPGYTFREGVDWSVGATSADTAASLRLALLKIPFLSVSRSGSVVYATAPAGAYYNSLQLVSSTPTALSAASLSFTGGRDSAKISINGVVLTQGQQFTAATSNANTATSIKNAINAAASLSTRIHAEAIGAVVTATSTKTGAVYNYKLASSNPSALSVSGALMTGGTTAADTLGSATIHAASHGLTPALAVLYSAGGLIGGLTSQTTYYAIPVDVDNFKLAASSSLALSGTGIVVTSTGTQLVANTYTLTALPFVGSSSFKWEVSNDGAVWSNLAVSSVTVAPSDPASSTIWSMGTLGTRFLRLNTVAPTSGGLALKVVVIGSN